MTFLIDYVIVPVPVLAAAYVAGLFTAWLMSGCGNRLYDLIRDPGDGRTSHTKLIALAGAASIILAFNRAIWMNAQLLSADLMIGVALALIFVSGSALTSKWLASKSGVRVDQPDPPTTAARQPGT